MTRTARTLALPALCALLFSAVALGGGIYVEGQIVVELNPGYTIEEVNERWGTTTLDSFPEENEYLLFKADVPDLEAFAEQMMTDPAVLEAEVNYYEDTPEGIRQMVIVAVGGDYVDYEDQQLTERIGLEEAHQKSTGYGVTVAVLDSGLDPDHIVFQGRLAPGGRDFVSNDDEPWEETDGIDDDGDGWVDDGYGHGTMVAGIIALVAPDARILPIRVLDDEGRSDAWTVARGIRYAVDQGADVINMSFGVPRTISTIGRQIGYADEREIPMVAGAGNQNRENDVYYPGADSKVMLITALDSLDLKADFADWNSKVLVSAPGTGVRSAYPGGEWGLGAGCSFATPFVTGEAALILSLAPEMENDALEELIEYSVDPIDHLPPNEPYRGKLGSGRVFLPRGLDRFVSGVPLPGLTSESAYAYPNPTRGAVRFHLPSRGAGTSAGPAAGASASAVFDASGRLVQRLAPGSLHWDGRNRLGQPVAPGVYFARVQAGGAAHRLPFRVIR